MSAFARSAASSSRLAKLLQAIAGIAVLTLLGVIALCLDFSQLRLDPAQPALELVLAN